MIHGIRRKVNATRYILNLKFNPESLLHVKGKEE